MAFWDFIRDIFRRRDPGGPANNEFYDYRDHNDSNFNNSFWQDDEDDNDNVDDFKHSRGGINFHFFSDPFDQAKIFESQMANILNSLFMGFGNTDANVFSSALAIAPPPPEEGNLRDKMLKSSDEKKVKPKLDEGLDSITTNIFSNVWDQYKNDINESVRSLPFQSVISKSVRKEFVRKPDGTVEQKQIIKDSEGNVETIVTQQIGDKVHTVITRKDKNGVETRTENIIDVDKSILDGDQLI